MTNFNWLYSAIWILPGAIYIYFSADMTDSAVMIKMVASSCVLFLVIAFIYSIFKLLKALIKKSRSDVLQSFYMLLLNLCAAFVISYGFSAESDAQMRNMRVGDQLVEAIKEHKANHGKYPESLSSPEFSDYRPVLKGSVFTLKKASNSLFYLGFNKSHGLKCSRDSRETIWSCSQ